MADLVSDIKTRLTVYDVVSQYVQLKKAGRNWKGLSPFKPEKTPSFVVSDEKQIWHCFSTGKGGDIFTFIQEYESVEFSEALKILAERAGLDMSNYQKSFNPKLKSEKDEMLKAQDLAADFFHEKLFKTNDGKKVLKYLYGRGLKDETIKEFKIGFAPNDYASLYPYLLKKGIRKDVLLKTGLVSSKKLNVDEIYDKFRGRLIFPIFDNLGRIVAFGGRALSKEQQPKYLNSPESLIYNKSAILYGLSHAKKHIKEKDSVILVEGYFDVVLPFQEGFKNVVATSGTALTEKHTELISRYTKYVFSSFDSDTAGFNATLRSYPLLKEKDIFVKVIAIDGGKDPADLVLADPNKFEEAVQNAKFFLEFVIDTYIKGVNIKDFEQRSQLIKRLLPFLKVLSAVEKDHYVRYLAFSLMIEERILYDEIESFLMVEKRVNNMAVPYNSKKYSLEETLFAFILEYPKFFPRFIENFLEEDFSNTFKLVYNSLNTYYNRDRDNFKTWDFSIFKEDELKRQIEVLSLYGAKRYFMFSEDILNEEFEKLMGNYKMYLNERRLERIKAKIRDVEEGKSSEDLLKLLKEQQEILSQIK